MQRKPIILILTSRDEIDCVSKKIEEQIVKIGTHNVVVVSDDKYGAVKSQSAIDKLIDSGSEIQFLKENKDRGVIRDRFTLRSLSRRVNRINNLIKRYHPEYILCVTPYAHHCALEAKRRARFQTQILYICQNFTTQKGFDDETAVFIVENADLKASLVRNGARSKSIMTMGLPFDISKKTTEEIATIKQDMGLSKNKTVFLKVGAKSKLREIFSIMLDQGSVFNLAVYCPDQKEKQLLGSMAVRVDMNVTFVSSQDKIDEYLSVCDMAITDYDPSVIYKCFKLGIVPIVLEGGSVQAQNDVDYLVSHNLVMRAKDELDVVGLTYQIMQTHAEDAIIENARKWVEFNSLENIANFLVSYIAV